MQRLYAVSFNGKMSYFSGSIPEDKFEELEQLVNEIDYKLPAGDFCKQFETLVKSKAGIELNWQPIAYIFRARRK